MGGINPVPNVLCIHNNVEPRSQQSSSKSRVTRKNSPWAEIEASTHTRGLPCLCVGLDSLARTWMIFNVSHAYTCSQRLCVGSGYAANLFTIRNNPTSASDQVVID
ncbi:hypothetical protein PIB30_090333 [Stylosanthes scabra]|uniref:Uncharacterized protein n=1 Tax=Stylosanthes scabra TaxID=79078 RepID=A0ABU6XWQ0_9FABA|nr:hypothetical protein [Stylosanthes scabra]